MLSLPLSHLVCLSAIRLKVMKDLRSAEARSTGLAMAAEVIKRHTAQGSGSSSSAGVQLPLLDPVQDMNLRSKEVSRCVSRLEALESKLSAHPLWSDTSLLPRLIALQHKEALASAARAARKELKAAQGLVLHEDLKARMRVLRRLGYIDAEGLVTAKGRVAAELNVGHDELVLTELILGGAFADAPPDVLAALCSCFVWSERSEVPPNLRESLSAPLNALRKAAREVGTAAADAKLGVVVDDFVDRFRPEMMEVTSCWVRGQRFADLLSLQKDVFEGSLVRALRRTEELMGQVSVALRGVGDVDLAGRFDDARERMKRGVVFAASLYL